MNEKARRLAFNSWDSFPKDEFLAKPKIPPFLSMARDGVYKVRLLPDSPVVTYQAHYKACRCCQEGSKGHTRFRAEVVDLFDGERKLWEFGHAIKRQLANVIHSDLEKPSCTFVKIGGMVLMLFSQHSSVDVEVSTSRKEYGRPFPTYEVKRI